MSFLSTENFSLFTKRRKDILDFLKKENPTLKYGVVILSADFENDRYVFRQESSFYYLTGIKEPAAIFCLFFDGTQILYLPNYGGIREQWTTTSLQNNEFFVKKLGIDQIKYLGKSCDKYSFSPIFTEDKYEHLLSDLNNELYKAKSKNEKFEVFTLLDVETNSRYFSQFQIYKNLLEYFPEFSQITRDIAPIVNYLRRFKSEYEIDLIYNAVQITTFAHQAAAQVIAPSRMEYEIQAIIESVFIQAGATGTAFPSIIASGKNTTILHYSDKNQKLKEGDLIVIDIGAEYKYYASDLTRTYPISGKFTQRQLDIYNIVLQVQEYIENLVKPGMFINNKNYPERSLNHLAINFLEKKGLNKYFLHSIGHFLGLDVHDVTSSDYPLAVGDVFTIEPGLYIPEENLGIRIEDDYLLTDRDLVCLSYQLPKKSGEIEDMMKGKI